MEFEKCNYCGREVAFVNDVCPVCRSKRPANGSIATTRPIVSESASRTPHPEASDFKALLELATPELYERNAFRLLEVHVEATDRDLSKRKQVMEVAARNKLPVPAGPCRILPRTPAPDDHEIRECSHSIQDAERRLAHEFFWFWPLAVGQAGNDACLRQLHQGDNDGPANTWRNHEQSHEEGPASKHNLAILYHFSALEVERTLLNGNQPPEKSSTTTPEQETAKAADADRYWAEASKYWKMVAVEQSCWSRVVSRIRAMDDKSLTTGAARRMEKRLPVALTLINARLAIRFQQTGKSHHAKRQVTRLRSAGFTTEAVDEALRIAVEPTRSAIKTQCDTAKKDAEADPAQADAGAQRLLEQTAEPLALLDLLLAEDNPARIAEHDQVALAALSCVISYGNKTDNWKRALELLDRLAPLAASTAGKERIAKEKKTVQGNFEGSRCWFCQRNEGSEKAGIKRKMHGNVQTLGSKVSWTHREVTIPRCKACKRDRILWILLSILLSAILLSGYIAGCVFSSKFIAQRASETWPVIVNVAAWIIVPILLLRLVNNEYQKSVFKNFGEAFGACQGDAGCVFLIILIAVFPCAAPCAIATTLARKVVCKSRGIKAYNEEANYPLILELKKNGWSFGEKPPGVQ